MGRVIKKIPCNHARDDQKSKSRYHPFSEHICLPCPALVSCTVIFAAQASRLTYFFSSFLYADRGISNHKSRKPEQYKFCFKKRTAEPLSEKNFSRKSSHTETSEKVHAECFQPAAFLLCRTTSPVLTYVQRLKNVTIIARFQAFVKQKRAAP